MRAKWIVALTGLAFSVTVVLADGHGERGGREGREYGESKERSERKGPDFPALVHAKWSKECSACHMAYQPGLLPERSWRKVMAGLDKHFGTDASLDDATAKEITDFLVKNSADNNPGRRSGKIMASLPANAAPLRISETPYFKRKHDEVPAATWKNPKVRGPAYCENCHTTANQGNYSERNVTMPR